MLFCIGFWLKVLSPYVKWYTRCVCVRCVEVEIHFLSGEDFCNFSVVYTRYRIFYYKKHDFSEIT